jgi:hypothetical protein
MIQSAIEKMPRIVGLISAAWGTRELDSVVSSLMTDTRNGTRQGFPVDAAAELLFLVQLNKIRRAVEAMQNLKIDYATAYRMTDQGDQLARGGGTWDNPMSSSEAARISRVAEPTRRSRTEDLAAKASGGPFSWLGRLVLFLLGSKIFWVIVVAALGLKIVGRKMGFLS